MQSLQKITVFGVCLLAVGAYPVSNSRNVELQGRDCKRVFRILGSSFVAGSVVAAALSYFEIEDSDKTKNRKRLKAKDMPKDADMHLDHWLSDKDFYPVASDIADYILDKYSEDPKFSARLMRYLETNPDLVISALQVRHGLKEQNQVGAKKLVQELGSRAHYALTFAWIIGAVYNEREKAPKKLLREVILGMEKEIDNFDSFIH